MAVYRAIHLTFWQDDFILSLSPEDKFFYLYLLTNSKTTQLGIYQIAPKVMELETGWNSETIHKLINDFVGKDKIKYSKETNEIFLLNWFKHNPVNNVNIFKCVLKETTEVKSKDFINVLIEVLKKYTGCWLSKFNKSDEEETDYAIKLIEEITNKPLTSPLQAGQFQNEAPTKKEEKEEEKYSPNSDEFRLSNLLFSMIKERNPKHIKPNFQKWAVHIDKLIRINKRSVKEIEDVIEWSQKDDFWCKNILSTEKLRKQFDSLFIKMGSASDVSTNKLTDNNNKVAYT